MKIKYLYLMTCVAAVVAACSQPPRPPEEIVAERAQARWEAMIARDFKRAWQFYTPGFREKSDPADFSAELSRRPVRWDSAEVAEVSCQQARCSVQVEVGYTAAGAPGVLAGMEGRRPVEETWIQIDGEWWYSAS
ncbi:MAG: hypothetical protein RQ847_08230 [Wenzhouxiangellaceae bacterium]|nr:hypothetical protein [Wenzhouxiangellaceae bacterium]